MKILNTKNMVKIAILGCLSYLLMLIKFPLPFMPPFMDFDLATIPELIGTFAMGIIPGILIAVVKLLLKLLTTGTLSMLTGEIQNLLLSCAFIIPAGIVYNKNKTKKNAVKGLILGTIISSAFAIFSNMYIIIPFYSKAFGLSMQAIIDMTQKVNPLVDTELKFVLFGIVPFNLIKNTISSVIVYAIYPKLSPLLHKENINGISKNRRKIV